MADTETNSDARLRSRLATTLTTWALIFLAIIALIALIVAGAYSYSSSIGTDAVAAEKRSAVFLDLVKYLLATVLPVVAGWVGTVLAFYYGKENFEAGTKSVTTAAQALTSKEKLATTMVATMGIARSEFNALVLDTADVNVAKTTDLQKVKEGFKNTKEPDKMYERLPILLTGDVPFMVLHRSTLNAYLVDAEDKDPKNSTLENLFAKVQYLPNDSFVAVPQDATAALAKTEMEKVPNCSDVFITTDGKKTGAVTRWITNVDLLKASEV